MIAEIGNSRFRVGRVGILTPSRLAPTTLADLPLPGGGKGCLTPVVSDLVSRAGVFETVFAGKVRSDSRIFFYSKRTIGCYIE